LPIYSSPTIPSPIRWLAGTARGAHTSCRRAYHRRKAREPIKHNILLLCGTPGCSGRRNDRRSHGHRHASPRRPWRGWRRRQREEDR
jgi:hypothetical protein